MARLVDVDELKLELKWLEDDTPVYHDVMSTIDEMPTVETKHGHWEVVDGTEPRRYGCSVCKRLSWTEDNYCSYCGARMDEVEDADT